MVNTFFFISGYFCGHAVECHRIGWPALASGDTGAAGPTTAGQVVPAVGDQPHAGAQRNRALRMPGDSGLRLRPPASDPIQKQESINHVLASFPPRPSPLGRERNVTCHGITGTLLPWMRDLKIRPLLPKGEGWDEGERDNLRPKLITLLQSSNATGFLAWSHPYLHLVS